MASSYLIFLMILISLGQCAPIDLRVTKSLATHGYDQVRLSVIDTQANETYGGFFDYNSLFLHKWTSFALHTTRTQAKVGATTLFNIGDTVVNVTTPKAGQGVRGVIFGDPCAIRTGYFIPCVDNMEKKLPAILNAAADSIDFWLVLGDNWYDMTGTISHNFFQQLSPTLKTKFLYTVPGNHDFWLLSRPSLGTEFDQFGTGFLQFYGQDTYSSANGGGYYNLSSAPKLGHLPPADNFFHYSQLGNVGFIGFSGAHSWEEQSHMFEEACEFFGETESIEYAVLYGHWSEVDEGCATNMSVPAVYKKLTSYPGCGRLGVNFINMYGHIHCNTKVSDVEFLVGATGFLKECADAGILYFDTTGESLDLTLFSFKDDNVFSNIVTCFQSTDNLNNCREFGESWRNATGADIRP